MAHAEHHEHHIVPLKILYGVFGGLVVLTVLTVLTARFVDLGAFNLPLALVIAGGKALLVVTFFMALKWDNRVNLLIFMLGLVFVVVFLTFTLFDTAFRGDLDNAESLPISDMERVEEDLQRRDQILKGEVVEEEASQASEEGSSH